jgi:hypothetical protein
MAVTEIVAIVDPKPPRYHHADVDGDRLLITTADIDGTPGVYFKTDPNGSSVPLSDLPELIARLQEIAEAASANKTDNFARLSPDATQEK